jgi:hypothetical protein
VCKSPTKPVASPCFPWTSLSGVCVFRSSIGLSSRRIATFQNSRRRPNWIARGLLVWLLITPNDAGSAQCLGR